ncbi:hypothetical protein WA026_022496 [Henosepilachna vigintioctopunctata]|uniref:Transmembrane protein 242 n=1 Tax=Henosepilachna vigintioctopunctata TaxID=420089 RepID=A0AAW1TSY1_9CUCU
MSEINSTKLLSKKDVFSTDFKWKATTFLVSLTDISADIGFSATLAAAKRRGPKFFDRGIMPNTKAPETGAQLALRALKWGTVYASAGCGVLLYSIWKLSGASDIEEFRIKMGSLLPRIPKNNPPVGRTEFTGLNDLLDCVPHLKGSSDE